MRLLVVEDHPTLRTSLTEGLREEGYAVDEAANGEVALHLAQVNAYDALLLDLMLPKLDGWKVLETLRRDENNVPVLCLTARDQVPDRVRGLDLGADDYLVKPFDWDELLARVRALVRRGYGTRCSVIRVADLEIDLAARSASRAGRALALTAREFALLELLALRRGEVVSRSDIWEHLYGHGEETFSNVVDVYIGYLRNKIDRDFESRLIHTRRGQGYILQVASDEAASNSE